MPPRLKNSLCALVPVVAAAQLHASGFAIIEQSVSGLGNAYAGGSAAAEDASTIFYNPAGITRLGAPELVVGTHLIMPSADFTNTGSLTFTAPNNAPAATQGAGDNGGSAAIVPNIYYVHPLSQDLYVGFGVHAPFGLVTEYDEDWVGRYIAVKSDLATINFNPTVAYRVTDNLSVGMGLSVEYSDVQLTSAIDLNRDGTTALDGFSDLKATSTDFGANIGALYDFKQGTRVGIHYRSAITHDLEGDADFTVPAPLDATAGVIFHDQSVSANLTVPETVSLSVFHQINEDWAVMADATWTNWSRFTVLDVNFSDPLTESRAGAAVLEGWEDTMRYSAGLTYKASESLLLRAGLAYDESPVPNAALRSPRIPDNDRLWIALGATWSMSETMEVSVGYVHIFVDDPVVDNSAHSAGQWLRGTFEASVDIVSVAGTLRF